MKRFVLVNKTKGIYDSANPIATSDLIALGGEHEDTSEMQNIANTGGTVIQGFTVDEYGHILTGASIDLDNRYLKRFTELDPTVPSHVKNITQENINTWNAGENQDNKVRTISIDPAVLPASYTKADLATHLNSIGFTISNTELIIIKMETGLEAETDAYMARVLADGGTVIDLDYVNLAYKLLKTEGRISQNYSWLSASMGLKKDANNKVSKLYSLKGAAWDLIGVGTSSMTWYATGQDNAPEILIDKVVAASMKPASAIVLTQPTTIFTVASITYVASNQYLYDGFSAAGRSLLLRNVNDAWTFGANSYSDYPQAIGVDTHIMQANYNGSTSNLFVDGVNLGTKNAGTGSFEYITLFNFNGVDSAYNMGGKFKDLLLLDSGVITKEVGFSDFFNNKYNVHL